MVFVLATGCEDELIETNDNPDVLTDINPENQFLSATISIHGQDFEAYYDFYRRIMPWMQYVTPLNGNGISFTTNVENFSNRYSRLYTGIGDALTDLEQLVSELTEEEQPRYVYMISIARILKAYYTYYVSDIYGSIPYEEAWMARYGGTLTPSYDHQQTLFESLDGDIEASIATLKTSQTASQISLSTYDQYFSGDIQSWVRAGNALRLKIATRLIKRNPAKATEIAAEVLSDDADNLMSSNAQGWVFKSTASFVSGGNWNPDNLLAAKPLVDFMWDYSDPRLDAFFAPNDYSQATIDILIADGELEAGTTESARRYFGSFTSPDDASAPGNAVYYDSRSAVINGTATSVDTLSLIQRRLFQPSFDEVGDGTAGTGLVNIPVITYADFCLMRAELAARGLTNEDAKTFYDAGVTASIQWYDEIAIEAGLINYTPVTQDEIDDYLARTDIAFDDAKALDQIGSQAYLNFFRQPAEGWASWKRTGHPSTTSVVALTDMKSNGTSLSIPRRAPLSLLDETSLNYENQRAAYDEMAQESGFGAGPTDAFGRVWWDVE